MAEKTLMFHGQESWAVRGDTVELAVTRAGGMMAPVTFYPDSNKPIRPYYVSPWAEEGRELDPPVLGPLRGDFFCLPFGANAETGGAYSVHGAPAGQAWTLVSAGETAGAAHIELAMDVPEPAVRITKRLRLRSGEPAVYTQHEIAGGNGAFPLGHHATLAPPPQGRLQIPSPSTGLA